MSEIDKARIYKVDDCKDITPVQLLRGIIQEIEDGDLECTGVVVITANLKKDGVTPMDIDSYRANLNRMEEMVVREASYHSFKRRWFD